MQALLRSLGRPVLGASVSLLILGSIQAQSARAHQPAPAGTPATAAPLVTSPAGLCVDSLRDQANPASCLQASSVPTLGRLFRLSQDLFVHPASGHVGIGTLFPYLPLEVVGGMAVSSPESVFKALLRPSANGKFGVLETLTLDPSSIPTVTNLVSTVGIDSQSGAMATFRGSDLLTALTTPANNSDAGYLAIRNANVEVAGINGGTGIVFGTAKAFAQPHPLDATKEIQYISLEGPEHGVYFRGSAKLARGEARIPVPESFALVAREAGLTVNLTPLGPNRGLYVVEKGLELIVVRENEGGSGEVAFDFLVFGVRAALPEHVAIRPNTHFAPAPGSSVPADGLPGDYRALMIRNGTLNADGSVNATSAIGLGWRQEGGAWRNGRYESAEPARD